MKVLILYATIEGQTEKIAQFAASEVEKRGATAVLVGEDTLDEAAFEGVDAVVLAAPVHQRRHPRKFEALVAGFKEQLGQRRTLLLSVSLNAAFPEGAEEAGEYVTEMNMRTHFTPDEVMLVAGAVRTAQYDYFAMQVIRHVVLKGQDIDPTAGEHEFTDWDAISKTLAAFLA